MENQGAWNIEVPIEISESQLNQIDWKAIAEIMGHHQTIRHEDGGIVYAHMEANDHPNREALALDMIENGIAPEDVTITACITHTVANTELGLPEIIVVNADHECASKLIEMIEERMQSKQGIAINEPVIVENYLIQLVPTSFDQLAKFKGAYESFIAIEVLMAQKNLKPVWLQAVYSDSNYRFPWEPGVNPNRYQPVPANPRRYDPRVTGNA